MRLLTVCGRGMLLGSSVLGDRSSDCRTIAGQAAIAASEPELASKSCLSPEPNLQLRIPQRT